MRHAAQPLSRRALFGNTWAGLTGMALLASACAPAPSAPAAAPAKPAESKPAAAATPADLKFLIGFASAEEHARGLAAAGADVVVARCGLTVGGMVGPKEPQLPLKASLAHIQRIVEAARSASSNVLCLAHGGPFARPGDTEALYAQADVHGFFGESAIERIPIEEGVSAEIAALKAQPLRAPATMRQWLLEASAS